MRYLFKIQLKALAVEARFTKSAERHHRDARRRLVGWFSKKHKKGEKRPIGPVSVELNDKHKEYAAEHFLKFWNLYDHRVRVIRKEARYTHLVDTFLKDKPYSFAECTGTHSFPDFDSVMDMASEYTEDGDNEFKMKFITWREDAEAFLEQNQKERDEKREEPADVETQVA